MSKVLVVGSVALDSVETPFGRRDSVVGGSANYFSISASFFSPIRVVAVVGEDFPEEHVELLAGRGIDLQGLQRVPGKTFHWKGRYGDNLNEAQTLATDLNVFGEFRPDLPEKYRTTPVVFLANIDPDLQQQVLDQARSPALVACDTMNYWIHGKRDSLVKLLERVDVLLVNETEARDLSGEGLLPKAADRLREMGPGAVVIKLGEYGALLFDEQGVFSVPAYPVRRIEDPTGAGDTFAGGFIGCLASHPDGINPATLRTAMSAGTVMASFNVESFGPERLLGLRGLDIRGRHEELREMVLFGELPIGRLEE